MKKTFTKTLVVLLLSIIGSAVHAQQSAGITKLLPLYLSLKEAFVNSDSRTANIKAAELENAARAIKTDSLIAQKKTFMALADKLVADAAHIAQSTDISHQRVHFETLSANMIQLAKIIKLSGKPIYQFYCPMRKAEWLSIEKTVENLYYGNQMLTCGEIRSTI